MDATYKDFVKDGPIMYLTRLSKDSITVRNGWERVLISFPIVKDGHGQVRVERIVLEYDAHAALLGGQIGNIVLAEENLAGGGLQKTADQIERGGFAAARGAEQADQLAVRDFEGEVVDCGDFLRAGFGVAGKLLRQVIQYDFHVHPFLLYGRAS